MDAKQQTREFIKSHPKMSFTTFKKKTNIKINECYYYLIRREIFPQGPRANAVNNTCVYLTTAAISIDAFLKDPQAGLVDLVKKVNVFNGLKLEVLKNIDNKTFEIRQMGVK